MPGSQSSRKAHNYEALYCQHAGGAPAVLDRLTRAGLAPPGALVRGGVHGCGGTSYGRSLLLGYRFQPECGSRARSPIRRYPSSAARAPSRCGVALPIRRAVGSNARPAAGKTPKAPGFWTSPGKPADFDLRSARIPESDVSSYPVGQTVQGGDAPWRES